MQFLLNSEQIQFVQNRHFMNIFRQDTRFLIFPVQYYKFYWNHKVSLIKDTKEPGGDSEFWREDVTSLVFWE